MSRAACGRISCDSASATDIHLCQDAIDALQQRFLGQRAGDSILLRHYLLDDPQAQGLLDIRDAIEADVRQRLGDLIVPTDASHQWGSGNPIRDRLAHIETVLTACGWRVAVSDDDDWLSSSKVACLLGIHPSKARERMTDGRIPATLRKWGTRDCWFARRNDVEAHLAETTAGTTVEQLASRLGQSYHQAYQELRRLGLAPQRPTGQRLLLSGEQVRAVTEEQERIRALHQRAVRVSEAARLVGRTDGAVRGNLGCGMLELDPETDSSGARFVPRASVERFLAARAPRLVIAAAAETMSFADVAAVTGLGRRQQRDLIRAGRLETATVGRDAEVTVESLHAWAVGFRPDLLARLSLNRTSRATQTRPQPSSRPPR